MKKENILTIAILIVVVLLLGFLVTSSEKELPTTNNFAKDWTIYNSNSLGVSIKYPKSTKWGEPAIFEVGNILVLTRASSSVYDSRESLTSLANDISILDKINEIESGVSSFSLTSWELWVQNIESEKDLETMSGVWFGQRHGLVDTCEVIDITESDTKGVYNVNVGPKVEYANAELGDPNGCFINWRVSFKYSPEAKKAVIWDRGQEDLFPLNQCVDGICEADNYIVNSLEFIK